MGHEEWFVRFGLADTVNAGVGGDAHDRVAADNGTFEVSDFHWGSPLNGRVQRCNARICDDTIHTQNFIAIIQVFEKKKKTSW